jgi:hypothetical protein
MQRIWYLGKTEIGMPKKPIFKNEYIFRIYELRKSGMTYRGISETLDVSKRKIQVWVNSKPLVRMAIDLADKARESRNKDEQLTFKEYVYNQLPERLQTIWDQIDEFSETENGFLKTQALLKGHGTRVRQHLFMYALTASNFNTSEAMRKLGINREHIDSWLYHDPDFAAVMDEIDYHKKNFFETALLDLVAARDSSAVLFVNRTKNRDRGYNDRVQVDVSGQIEHKHQHAVIHIDALRLPLETRKQILNALREQNHVSELKDAKEE